MTETETMATHEDAVAPLAGQWRVVLYKISGTDPEKETHLQIWQCTADRVPRTLEGAVDHIRHDMVHDCCSRDPTAEQIASYDRQLAQFASLMQQETWCVDPPRFWQYPASQPGTYRKFQDPECAALVAVETHSSYDFHYYLGVQAASVPWITVHNH